MTENNYAIKKKHVIAIEEILSRGNDVEIRKRPSTGEIVVYEVAKKIKCGK